MKELLPLLLGMAIGSILGVGIGWLMRAARAQSELTSAHARAEGALAEAQQLRLGQAQMTETLTVHFRNLASEILDEKSRKLSQSSSEHLGGVLTPLRENLESFRKRIEEIHHSQVESGGSLRQQLEQLSLLNNRLSNDAQNLASALQGKSQRRGAWGELILERTLELSGLERGREFELQVSTEGRLRPDAVIHLPEDRFIVVDSKVSLVDYERSCNAPEETERQQALLNHAAAVRTHIKSLSEKGYPDLFAGRSPEVTMMFLPIEPAFGAALSADPNLFEFAFAHRIILVTPSTLLAALRTVTNVWKVEKQTKNVLEIARLGGVLHDKLADFSRGLLGARERLAQAVTAQDEALARLSSQKGNILGTALRLRDLGAKAEKQMPRELIEEISSDQTSSDLTEDLLPPVLQTKNSSQPIPPSS